MLRLFKLLHKGEQKDAYKKIEKVCYPLEESFEYRFFI